MTLIVNTDQDQFFLVNLLRQMYYLKYLYKHTLNSRNCKHDFFQIDST